MLPGLKLVPHGAVEALEEVYDICKENKVLFIANEIQAGSGRSGKLLACDWDNVEPDIIILGRALDTNFLYRS